MPSLRDALEAALVEDPDDVATHHAYADYLQEQGDPRGEFIQVQLALEQTGRSRAERKRLKSRERNLLARYRRDWLGVLADELLEPEDKPRKGAGRRYEIFFERGWLDRIISNFPPPSNLAQLLSRAPSARLLSGLYLVSEDLAGVRAIVQSSCLPNLSHLYLLRSDLGDVGCTELATSGILKRLKELGLLHSQITDAGARILADCPDLPRLERLDMRGNVLTQTGLDTLRRVLGNALEAGDQQTDEEQALGRYVTITVRSTPGGGCTRSGRRKSRG